MLITQGANTPVVVETDICVIGAGAAGITFAREFIDLPVRVTLLESGQFTYDDSAQRLAAGEVDSYYFDKDAIAEGRRKQFGGTTNMWVYTADPDDGRRYARCLPPEEIDLAPCTGQSSACWPVTLEDLDPFFRRAQSVWNGGPFDYAANNWSSDTAQPIDTPDGVLITRICQHGPRDVFAVRYRDDLLSAANVDIYLGCTGLALDADSAPGRAQSLSVARGNGERFSVAAKLFVVAGGGVENSQLLLSSALTRPGAVGNRHDNVGRYVTSHPEFRMGTIDPSRHELFDEIGLYDLHWVGRHMVSGFLTIAEDVKRSENLLNMSVGLIPRGRTFGTETHLAMASLSAAVRRKERESNLFGHLRPLLRSPRDATSAFLESRHRYYEEWRGGWSQQEADRRRYETIELWAAPEQTAERDNKLSLSDTRDALGRQRIKLDWRWSQGDRDNIDRSIAIFGSQIEAAGIGRFHRWSGFLGPSRPRQPGFHHQMGGTRMHVDPALGVLDENCLVHGLTNVYLAGSSVFPTGLGYANPTLTLLSLTLRLADHVKSKLGVAYS
ncbi:MAG: hypothetical protein QOH60_2900 [Mycobacterium sp.]|jgi:choline dehydrogenase-like flavoprotein|nr:hypothetical protein [Mycobacterium sp.]